MKLNSLLVEAKTALKEAGVVDAESEAKHLLAHVLLCSPSEIYLNFNKELSDVVVGQFFTLLSKRLKRQPFAYVTGECEFYDLKLTIDSRVLVPRQETELLVERVVGAVKKRGAKGKVFWDVCTGSGCIGLAVKKHCPELKVICSDISQDALDVAAKNATSNGLDVEFRKGEYLEPFKGDTVDYFVSNPPYVADNDYDELELEVKCEPKLALLGGEEGLDPYKCFSKDLYSFLKPGGMAWFEMGFHQAEAIKNLFNSGRWRKIQIFKDLSGLDRVFFLEKE